MSEKRKSHWSILVKPTNDCNLNCKYCYDLPLRQKYGKQQMTLEMVDHIAKLASGHAEEIQWIWHGGEPTLMGVDWYRKATEIIWGHYKSNFAFSMQSNGLLLDDSWAKLSKDLDINIGMSFDVFTQTSTRVGSTTNQAFIDKLNLFKEYGKSMGCISVVTKENMDRQIELYEFFKKKVGNQPAFNHIYRAENSVKFGLEPEVKPYLDSFEKYFRYWIKDTSEPTWERSVQEGLEHVIGGDEVCCTNADCRNGWLGVNANGDVYPCDRQFPEKYFLGNIMDYNSIEEIYNSEPFKMYYSDITKRFMNHCVDCGYWENCRGGCNGNHIAVTGSGESIDEFSCEIFKGKMELVYGVLREIDVYHGNYNSIFLKKMVEHPSFFPKEIMQFLAKMGYPTMNLLESRLGRKPLLETADFKLFKIFSTYKRSSMENPDHTDFGRAAYQYSINLTEERNLSSIRDNRFQGMMSVFNKSKKEIEEIILSTVVSGGVAVDG